MRIARLRISNHRAIPEIDVVVREHLVLIGPNESGKTSLLRLLDAVFGGSLGALYALIDAGALRDPAHPMLVEVELSDFSTADKAALADQIEVLADGSLRLRIMLRATLDPTSGEVALERLFLKPGQQLAATAVHLKQVGWAYLPAGRSPDRELGAGRTGAIRSLLGAVDLGVSLPEIVTAIERLHEVVHGAPSLISLRKELAGALTDLLPRDVEVDDLMLELPRADGQDPLADIDVKLKELDHSRSLRDQSDGVRAMSTVAIQLLTKNAAQIVGVDEPEIHLHPRAQARAGSMLRVKAAQAVIATHSPAVLTQFSPMHTLAFAAGTCRQLSGEPFADDPKAAEHWWTTPALEPLTSRGVILVEGVADRVVVEAVAAANGLNLDRLGIVVATVNGAGGFKMALHLFGSSGFDIPLAGLVDLKEAGDVAKYLGIDLADVPAAGFAICNPDLEVECVGSIGAEAHARLLCASGSFTEMKICKASGVNSLADLEVDPYASWCRRNKVQVAVALAASMGPAEAAKLTPLLAALATIVGKVS